MAYRANLMLCTCTMCVSVGALKIKKKLEEEIKKHNLEDEIQIILTGSSWLCTKGPTLIVQPDDVVYQLLKEEDIPHLVEEHFLKGRPVKSLMYVHPETLHPIEKLHEIPFYRDQRLIALWNRGVIDPDEIEEYIARDGYKALAKVLKSMTPEEIIQEIKDSGLRGRGGAGFPTGRKWEFCRKNPGAPRYLICNADEGDPGAFMDRSIIEADPHSLIEGMIIAAYAIGAKKAYVYVRIEYPLAIKRLIRAISQAREYGLLGKDIFGSGFDFDIEIFRGAGAFVCGEETSLIHSIEGRPAEPSQKPPFPVEKGLFGNPTVINNVETLTNVPRIINFGAKWFAAIGTEKSKGTKVFSLAGNINNAGLVEVPMGITLREMVYNIGGGIPKGKNFKAVQTGGPSGGVIPAKLLDLPVDYERLQEAGAIMGSGGMIVMDEDSCMVDIAKYFLTFTNDESCGKCTSCREGSSAMLEVLARISEGKGEEGDIEFLEELGQAIKDASQCGLGQTLPNPVLSALQHFRDEYIAHIKYKKCPAVVCKGIISSPCQYSCPLGQDVPAYITLVAEGKFEEALEVIRITNPLPAICGRVCPRMCEPKCRQSEAEAPLSIRSIKRFVADYEISSNGKSKISPYPRKYDEKVAIVGSGPAGLACGFFLAQRGYEVTIFEKEKVAGGMLALTIPEYRLPKKIVEYEINRLIKYGVKIKTDTEIDNINKLFKQGYKAVFIATGAHKSRKLGIPGEDAEGVLDPIKFLKDVKLNGGSSRLGGTPTGKPKNVGTRHGVSNKKVAVVGAGNVAIDVARTSLRLGAKEVFILYRRTRAEMPAADEEINAAIEEGVKIHYLTLPKRVVVKNGKVCGVECIKMSLGEIDASGRPRPIPIEGSEFKVELDAFLPAITQEPDLSFLKDVGAVREPLLQTTRWNTIVVDDETLVTEKKGIFAGGDVVTGPLTVTNAMGSGKLAAESIHKYLRGESLERIYSVVKPSVDIEPIELSEDEVEQISELGRMEMPTLEVSRRKNNFDEVELGLSEDIVKLEAKRCLRCDRG